MKNSTSYWDVPSFKFLKLALTSLNKCLPIKICCRHGCFSSLVAIVILPIIKYFDSQQARLRFQLHNTLLIPTVLNDLETFGLHRDILPKSIGGNYVRKPTWIKECERILHEQYFENHRDKRQRRVERY